MRKHNLSRSEAKSHRLQLHQTAIQIKHKRKGTKKDQERERMKPFGNTFIRKNTNWNFQ